MKIGFWLHDLLLVDHFRPLWSHLEGGYDVVVPDGKLPPYVKALPGEKVIGISDAMRSRRYDIFFSNHAGHTFQSVADSFNPIFLGRNAHVAGAWMKKLAKKNVRLMYSAGKLEWNLSDWNRVYDGFLVFGPMHDLLFSKLFRKPIRQVGYPRFDCSHFDESAGRRNHLSSRLDPSKPTVGWLPTWGDQSSIEGFLDEIIELQDVVNVIAKPHPLDSWTDKDFVAKGLKISLGADWPSRDVYELSDLMLFDYGGPVFGAIRIGKPFAFLDTGCVDREIVGLTSFEQTLRKSFPLVSASCGGLRELLNSRESISHDSELAIKALEGLFFSDDNGCGDLSSAVTDLSWLY